ncbi:hypothetical protein Ahy_A02g009437 [Arachis hypogaea]|uniref:PB1-like domain-containing protein n=1 Tax=Arachis hypogaea TaxID=3818 RepID=A0A445EGZ9_ARAHY|nr:hypothetical protein Ahy_A02g009437 [Arachis hypogaea]
MHMTELINIMIHHGVIFKKNEDDRLVYSPNNRACLGDLDVDTLDVFYVRNYYKELGYSEIQKCWWLVPGSNLEVGLRNLDSDNELMDICYHAQKNKGWVEVYYEHGVSLPEVLEGDTSVVYLDNKEDVGQGPNETPISNFKPTLVDAPFSNSKPNEQDSNSNIGLSASPTPTPTTANIIPIPKPQPSKPTNISNKPNSTIKSSIPSMITKSTTNPTKFTMPTNPKTSTKPTKPTKSTKPTNPKPSTKPTNPKKSTNPTSAINSSKPTQVRKPCTRSASKREIAHVTQASIYADDSSDSYENAEDELYRPGLEGSSSSSNEGFMSVKGRRSSLKFKHASASIFVKLKEKIIIIKDDGLVEDVSDGEVDIDFVGADFGLDPGVDSDEANLWHFEEMKTPPNSDEELTDVDSDDGCPLFRDGERFGELVLEVGMKFTTKWEFKEAVREYTIQEGRRLSKRVRVVCKVKECPRLVYTSRDHEDTCWQIKTFNNDHTCAREDRNRAANCNWVYSKLVKKVKKYPTSGIVKQ